MPVNLSFGEYEIVFSGDWSHSDTFVIGDSVVLDKEYVVNPWYWFLTLDAMTVGVWVGLAVATAPFLETAVGDEINSWIAGDGDDSFALIAIAAGVLGIRSRLAQCERWVQWMLFVLVLLPWLIPSGISLLDGHVWTVFCAGYFVDMRYYYDPYPQLFCTVFVMAVVLPHVFYVGHSAIPRNFGFSVDLIVVLVGALGNLVFIGVVVAVSLGTISVLLSPMFTWIPYGLFIWNVGVRRGQAKAPGFAKLESDMLYVDSEIEHADGNLSLDTTSQGETKLV
jgi:hypothetical protein